MKHAIPFFLAATATVGVAQPAAKPPENHNAGVRTSKLAIEPDHGVLFVRDFCAHGMQFIAVVQHKTSSGKGSGGVAVTQVLDGTGKPMPCGKVQAAPN